MDCEWDTEQDGDSTTASASDRDGGVARTKVQDEVKDSVPRRREPCFIYQWASLPCLLLS